MLRRFFGYFLYCCRDESDKEIKEKTIKEIDMIDKIENSTDNIKNCLSFEEPDKEHLPENDITEVKDNTHLRIGRAKRPTIILSMDGSEHKIVLYDGNAKPKKKNSKSKRKKKKHTK